MALACLSVFWYTHSQGQPNETSGEEEVVAIGSSPIQGGNLAEAKKNAIAQALRKGVERYLMDRLGGQGLLAHFDRVITEVLPKAREGTENYHILAEERIGDEYNVLVRLRISKRVVDESLKAAGLLVRKAPRIAVLFLVSETRDGAESYWWSNQGNPPGLTAVELALHKVFQEKGLSPINRVLGMPAIQPTDALSSRSLEKDDIMTWARAFSADALIYGHSEIATGKEIHLSLKAFDVRREALVSQGTLIEPLSGSDTPKLMETLERMVNDLVTPMVTGIVQAAAPEDGAVQRLDVTLRGVTSLKQLVLFRDFLRQKVAGVKAVRETVIGKNAVSLEVTFQGDKNRFIGRLLDSDQIPFPLDIDRSEGQGIAFKVAQGAR